MNLVPVWQAAAGGSARKGKKQSLSGIRIGKHGMTVSCKSAAAAATAAAASATQEGASNRSKKRKHTSSSHEDGPPTAKSRKLLASASKSSKKIKGAPLHEKQQPAHSSNGSDSSDEDNMQVALHYLEHHSMRFSVYQQLVTAALVLSGKPRTVYCDLFTLRSCMSRCFASGRATP